MQDVTLPGSDAGDQWCELLIHTATPGVGKQWTDTGTKWLDDGIPPAQVAEWAGNSMPVLPATYARCVEGQLPDLKKRLEAAGDLPEPTDAG
ncbi:hypothetical protein [Streptomyces sp. 303MFCol5.2]|uniref:hypothetical protein n=1 Tax=Streptomyces sp. 303MFCol5.2 TaxID=1172181 RepID=UPI001F36E830|nr:hypothetical protein [Streptomyces sp. 303MFCol5.2]